MEVVLHGDRIKGEEDVHHVLSEQLDFGPYYGANLAALRDRLTTDVARPLRLVWKDAELSRAAMGEEGFAKIVQVFRRVEELDREWGATSVFTFSIE